MGQVEGRRAARPDSLPLATEVEPDELRAELEDARYSDGRRQVKVQVVRLAKVQRARGATRR